MLVSMISRAARKRCYGTSSSTRLRTARGAIYAFASPAPLHCIALTVTCAWVRPYPRVDDRVWHFGNCFMHLHSGNEHSSTTHLHRNCIAIENCRASNIYSNDVGDRGGELHSLCTPSHLRRALKRLVPLRSIPPPFLPLSLLPLSLPNLPTTSRDSGDSGEAQKRC